MEELPGSAPRRLGTRRLTRLRLWFRGLTPKRGQPRTVFTAIVQHFLGEEIALRAAALTYVSIFSIVPLATLALHLLASFHQEALINRLHTFIEDVLAPGIRRDSAALLNRLLRAATDRSVSWVSIISLLIAGGSLLKNLDSSLNELWNVREQRPLWIRLGFYAVAMTLGPLLLAASLASSTQVHVALVWLHLPNLWILKGGFIAPAIGLSLLYGLAPTARVQARPAILGGLAAGFGWAVAKTAYATFASRIFRYNLLYGSLGAAPLFLVWLYLSWLIVLAGARLSYAIQHAAYRDEWPIYQLHPHGPELLGAALAQEFARASRDGRTVRLEELAHALRSPQDIVAAGVTAFEKSGLIFREGHRGYVVARPPEELTLAQACLALRDARRARLPVLLLRTPASLRPAESAFQQADEKSEAHLRGISWASLAQRA